MMDIENEYARHEELFSMLYGSSKWDGARVAEGLRSEHLSNAGRAVALSLLADLIDGTDPFGGRQLKLAGGGKRVHIKDARAEYDRIMQIGGWVQAEIDKGEKFRSAIAGAEDEFGVSESTAQRATTIFRKRTERAEETGLWYPVLPVRRR